jgi:hypothetical protein
MKSISNSPKWPNNLRYYRLKRKYTQHAAAEQIGHKCANRLSTWETGTKNTLSGPISSL